MAGCLNGADPAPGAAGTQQLLNTVSLAASVLTFFRNHRPTALAGISASLVDVDALCALNPDPPRTLSALDVVESIAYTASGQFSVDDNLTQWLYEWLRYQAFSQFCVCRAPPLDPTLNCLHATNLTLPNGEGGVVPLGVVVIESAVYDSWTATPNTWRILSRGGKTSTQTSGQAVNWNLQLQYANGVWTDHVNGAAFPEGSQSDFALTIQGGFGTFNRSVPVRIFCHNGAGGQVQTLDFCFRPQVLAPLPPPEQPEIPTLPVVPAPVCSTDDLCAIVQELSRQLTRMAAQISDIQAQTSGTTSVLQVLSSQAISGEGEATLVPGTRAVSLELTHVGSGVFTSALGRPRGLMRAGSVRWGDGVGYSRRQFVDADRFDRDRPPGALTLSWQLINECTATLKMLG